MTQYSYIVKGVGAYRRIRGGRVSAYQNSDTRNGIRETRKALMKRGVVRKFLRCGVNKLEMGFWRIGVSI